MGTDLYRFYDADDVLLYVGISLSAITRANQHRVEKEWWSSVARMDVEHIDGDRAAAELAEREAIKAERPIHNVIHNIAAATKSMGITWLCEICELPIANKTGYIGVSTRESLRHKREREQFELDHPRIGGLRILSGAALFEIPKLAHWQVIHRSCDPDPEGGGYWIEIERASTEKELLNWTAHLMHKRWLAETDWHKLLERTTAVSR